MKIYRPSAAKRKILNYLILDMNREYAEDPDPYFVSWKVITHHTNVSTFTFFYVTEHLLRDTDILQTQYIKGIQCYRINPWGDVREAKAAAG